MKTKIYKLLSVVLAMVVAFSTCLCIVNAETGTGTPEIIKPAMAQGTINGTTGAVESHVETRIYTQDLLPISHFIKATIASGYKTYFHFYNADEAWIGSCGTWIENEIQIKDLPELTSEASFFRVVLGTTSNANIVAGDYDDNAFLLTTSSEYVAPVVPELGDTYSPAMSQGTIDGNAGEIKAGVENRLYTTELVAIADCFNVVFESGYKAFYHFYDADKNWIGTSGKWVYDELTGKEIKNLSPTATYFRLAVGASDDSALPVDQFYAGTLVIGLVPGVEAPVVPDLPVKPEEPEGPISPDSPIIPDEELPEHSYFISVKGKAVKDGERPEGLGTRANPVKTFEDVTRLIKEDGLTAEDTAYVFIKSGERVNWSTKKEPTPVAHPCRIVVDSENPDNISTLIEDDIIDVVGDMTFKNVRLYVSASNGILRLNHHDLVFEEGSVVDVNTVYIGARQFGGKYSKDFNLTIKGQFNASKVYISSTRGTNTYEGDINILVDNKDASLPILLTGSDAVNTCTYNGNINITVLNAKTVSFANDKGKANFNGGLQILVDSNVVLPYAFKTTFEDLKIDGGKWYITAKTNDTDFIQLTETAGKFNIKNKATAYIRQLGGKLITDKDGVVDLSAKSGAYTISDKPIDELLDDSHKMLYFKCGGGSNTLLTFAAVTPGETYRFEYSIFTSHFEDSYPTCRENGDRYVIGDDMKVISKKPYENYYKVVAEITIPETYTDPLAFFGVYLASSSTGVIFDRNVYNVNDPKTNLIRNPKLHSGLDDIALNFDFWGIDVKNGKGLLEWTNGVAELSVMSVDPKFIDHLIYLADPDDGEWWKPGDIIEETYDTYADAFGTFTDQNGNPIKGVKFWLVSEEHSYSDKTNSKGEFEFKHILTGLYDLYFQRGSEKVATGYSQYIGQYDLVKFDVVTDLTNLLAQNEAANSTVDDGEEEEEIIPTGNFAATVYTSRLEIVSGLKVILRNIGEVVTDANGSFAFANIPVGTYDLYTVLEDGTEYVFRQVVIEENRDITSKLRFAPEVPSDADNEADNGWIIWVIVSSVVALVVVAGLIFLLVFKKKSV